jgi:hypothetical protein
MNISVERCNSLKKKRRFLLRNKKMRMTSLNNSFNKLSWRRSRKALRRMICLMKRRMNL